MSKSKYLQCALEAAEKAAAVIKRYYAQKPITEVKNDGSPVTEADREAERVIISHIQAIFPDHGFYAEESGDRIGGAEYVWILDPIDGTKNFIRHVPNFSTEIALMHNDVLIVGVSRNPITGDVQYAERGFGAYINDTRASVSAVERLSDAYMTIGSPALFTKPEAHRALMDEMFHIRSFGDFEACKTLITGGLDVLAEPVVHIYDIAAKTVIIEEAGGRATDFAGNDVSMGIGTYVATNGKIHGEVVQKLVSP